MTKLTIAGICRKDKFSPNHIGNDAAIFNLTAEHLEKKGCEIHKYAETDLILGNVRESIIFNMVREWQSIHKLQEMEDKGCRVMNSAYGIENCTREKMTRLLIENEIPHPQSLYLNTNEDPEEALVKSGFHNCWIKRGDFHAIHREDVTYVRHPDEAKSILREYAIRGIRTAVVNEHLNGDLVKFYGVKNTDFFFWFYPSSTNHSKFGLEQINGTAKGIPFDEQELKNICSKAGDVLNVNIYGGDCIINENGEIRLIDFNDWPSFAPCREEAAKYIAQRIYMMATE
ncbi:hypothetical protein [Massilibacteroides sp.]|uniref:hypothetical protein n=1 Tax=Massilibacteroides sp. TaxID=2034766 RepID=UPI002634B022|nr:hypothetical protein [Massilibacteroides sp.]MDD4514376.1 hypothetical protein [Massilibacteroides sp.]